MLRNPQVINLLETKFGSNPDFTLERSIATDDSLLKSDVLICDCSGVALEYAFGTERPVLFLDVPYKIQNEKYEELDMQPLEVAMRAKVGVIISPEKLAMVPKVIARLQAEQAQYKQRIAKLKEKYLYAFGQSTKIGAEYVVKLVDGRTANISEQEKTQ